MNRTRPSRGEERWPERAPPTWCEAAAVTATGEDGGVRVDEERERDERLCLRLPSNKCDGEPKLLCTTSFATHVLLIIYVHK